VIRLDGRQNTPLIGGKIFDSCRETDTLILIGVMNEVPDLYATLGVIRSSCGDRMRLIIVSYNRLWRQLIRHSGAIGTAEVGIEVWIPPDELQNLLEQSEFEVVSTRKHVVVPVWIPIISRLANRWLAPLPFIRAISVFNVIVSRPVAPSPHARPSISVIVPARNEEGNIANLVARFPDFQTTTELIFVEGGSRDNTLAAIEAIVANTSRVDVRMRALTQRGEGKADAVREGLAVATGDIFMILDADLSVPPEELPRFADLLVRGVCDFANGSRLVYPMERQAMRFLNLVGNRLFGLAFTFLLGQPIRDTLCGTKAMWAADYLKIAGGRRSLGVVDPFGDFDLLFGASRLHLKIRDVPVHYKERTYGRTNISRFRHGVMLLRMTIEAARRLKFV
jgi:hypothetical protein